jgi:zinc transporter ZupT
LSYIGYIVFMIWIIAIAAAFATLLGGLFAIKWKDKLHLILGFSAGTVMGVALFDLVPQSFELTKGQNQAIVPLLMATGFIAYMIIERSFSIHRHPEEPCSNPNHKGEVGATTLVVHSLLDGMVIGLSFQVSASVGLVVSLAVLAHKFSDGINTVSALLLGKSKESNNKYWLTLAALAPLVGIGLSMLISLPEESLGLILAVFAGLFLYLGASDLIPESHHRHPTLWTTSSTILGMAVIYLAIRIAGV